MAFTHVWSKGQVTIPVEFRRRLHLEDNTPLSVVMLGEALVMVPFKTEGTKLAKKFEKEMKKQNISFEDLLSDLKEIRKKTNKEKYGL
ncbi:MAG: AbrB/MazE/SpoVT family DNA-binding domain-containing protein [Elusimicrobiota bacterium]